MRPGKVEGRLRWVGCIKKRDNEYIGRRILKTELMNRRKRETPTRRFWM